ncbi:MAG: MMPL family transporter [Oscillospiraceae bacterium]|nr:MMPL family transporter [Oscillospiraceae bacterium]
MLIVECILMGATIDYGILFTNYYRENRETVSEREAVKNSFEGAMHTILTSGLILIIVTGIIGFLSEGTMSCNLNRNALRSYAYTACCSKSFDDF